MITYRTFDSAVFFVLSQASDYLCANKATLTDMGKFDLYLNTTNHSNVTTIDFLKSKSRSKAVK